MATTTEDAAARELGAIEFITKPVDFDQLKEQLRQLPAATD
jgi:DNA-binding NtrC family response regulator